MYTNWPGEGTDWEGLGVVGLFLEMRSLCPLEQTVSQTPSLASSCDWALDLFCVGPRLSVVSILSPNNPINKDYSQPYFKSRNEGSWADFFPPKETGKG